MIAVRVFGLAKKRGKIPPHQVLRRISEQLGEGCIARAEFSVQVRRENRHRRRARRSILAAANCNTGEPFRIAGAVGTFIGAGARSQHMAFGMMVPHTGCSDREACYEEHDEGNRMSAWPHWATSLPAFRNEQARYLSENLRRLLPWGITPLHGYQSKL